MRPAFEAFDFAFIENVPKDLRFAALTFERQLPDRSGIIADLVQIEQGAMRADRTGEPEQEPGIDQEPCRVFAMSVPHLVKRGLVTVQIGQPSVEIVGLIGPRRWWLMVEQRIALIRVERAYLGLNLSLLRIVVAVHLKV